MTADHMKRIFPDIATSQLVSCCRSCGEWTLIGSFGGKCYMCGGEGICVEVWARDALRGFGFGFYGGNQ